MIFFHNPRIRFEPKHPWQEKKEALAEWVIVPAPGPDHDDDGGPDESQPKYI